MVAVRIDISAARVGRRGELARRPHLFQVRRRRPSIGDVDEDDGEVANELIRREPARDHRMGREAADELPDQCIAGVERREVNRFRRDSFRWFDSRRRLRHGCWFLNE